MNKRNAEGYSDPTAYAALKNIEAEERRVKKLRGLLASMSEMAGFRMQGKIVLVDKRTGKIWR